VPGGAVARSTHHPTMDRRNAGGGYFETRRITETRREGGQETTVSSWRRPLTAMGAAFPASWLAVEDVVGPMSVEERAERFPDAHASLTTSPRFLFFRLAKPR